MALFESRLQQSLSGSHISILVHQRLQKSRETEMPARSI
jgi:hypothetical protein